MAKKPPKEEDLDDENHTDSLFDDTQELPNKISGDEDDDDSEEEEDFEEEVVEKKDYKYVSLELTEGLHENDHILLLKGQSHGFCNLLVKQLLNIKGVISAAYRITTIKPAEIFIRLEDGINIMDILYEAIEALRNEGQVVKELFNKLM